MPIGQFAFVFSLAYAALKWNYILPLIWNQEKVQKKTKNEKNEKKLLFQNWIFASAGIAITLAQSLLNFPKISKETSYLTGLVALATVISPHSKSWMAAATAIHLELINVLVQGNQTSKIVAGCGLGIIAATTALNAKKTILKTFFDYLHFITKI